MCIGVIYLLLRPSFFDLMDREMVTNIGFSLIFTFIPSLYGHITPERLSGVSACAARKPVVVNDI